MNTKSLLLVIICGMVCLGETLRLQPKSEVAMSGLTLGMSQRQVEALLGVTKVDSEQCYYYQKDGLTVGVRYRERSEGLMAGVLWGDSASVEGVTVKKGDAESAAFALMAKVGPVIVRYGDPRNGPDTSYWVSPGSGRWLWCHCNEGKVRAFGLEDLSYGLGMNQPAPHQAKECQKEYLQNPCLECSRGISREGTGTLDLGDSGISALLAEQSSGKLLVERITISGVALNATPQEVFSSTESTPSSDTIFEPAVVYSNGEQSKVLVEFDTTDKRATLLIGNQLELEGRALLVVDDSEEKALSTLSSLGTVVIRRLVWHEGPDRMFWLATGPTSWLTVSSKDGLVINIEHEDTRNELGRRGPSSFDPSLDKEWAVTW